MPITLILRNPLDRDAREYISRAGVTDATARLQLNEFVRGVKNLGLWSNMVCWPLRSAQNYGGANSTDTRVASLGGLGTFDGTRVNGPTWGADGVDFDGTNDHITTSFNPSFSNVQAFAAVNADNHNARRLIASQRGNSNSLAGWNFYTETTAFGTIRTLRAEVYDTVWRLSDAGQIADGSWASTGLYWDKSFVTGFRDSQVGTPAAAFFTGTRNLMIGSNDDFWWDGKISALIIVHDKGDVFSQLRSLYKSTLGTGLGLP